MAAPGRQSRCGRRVASLFAVTLWFLSSAPQVGGDQSQGAVFLREFTLIRRESLNEDFLPDLLNNNHKTEDTEQLNKLVLTYRSQIVSLLCILDTYSALHLYHLCSERIILWDIPGLAAGLINLKNFKLFEKTMETS